ncbi:hypothetical protein PC115_g6801 [Phytophthora cactorum]|uniref:Uncharacterized protein n=1 Tax=Phytophthora cactorum TaxID=29920 RepID=A0A8T1CXH4_9STRA|nr:hypothetical protein PC115_g6801 [Phytophthora cactorum]
MKTVASCQVSPKDITAASPTPRYALVSKTSRYFHLYEHLSPDDEDLEDFISSRFMHRSLCKLFEELHDVESTPKKLQTAGLTMMDARNLLDGLLEVQPTSRRPHRALAEVRLGYCEGAGRSSDTPY